jgi:hypothetical protein
MLEATTFRCWQGVVWLVVTLPDGSSGTIAAKDTDVLGPRVDEPGVTILSADGLRHLRTLLEALGTKAQSGPRRQQRK